MRFLNNEEKFNQYGYYLAGIAALASVISPKLMNNCLYLLIILLIFRYCKFKVGIKLNTSLKIGVISFFAGLLLSSSLAPNWPQGYPVMYAFFSAMCPFLLSYLFVNNRRQLIIVVTLLAVSIGVASVYGIYQGLSGMRRVTAFFGNTNSLAFFLDIYVPLLYVATIERDVLPRHGRIISGFVTVFAIIALGYTGTRGAWLAIGFTFIAYALLKVKDNKKLGVALCISFLLLSVSLLQVEQVRNRFDTMFNPQFTSNSERILIWESSVAMWREYPIAGVGLSSFRTHVEKYISPLHKEKVAHHHAHNVYLTFLAETGLVGVSGYLVLFGCIIYQLSRNCENTLAKAALLITVNLLLHGLVDYYYDYRPVMQTYWFILGLAFASVRISAGNRK